MQLSAALVATAHEAAHAVQAARAAHNDTAIHRRPARGWRGRCERAQSVSSAAKREWPGISNRRPRRRQTAAKCRLHGIAVGGQYQRLVHRWHRVAVEREVEQQRDACKLLQRDQSVHMQTGTSDPPKHRHTLGSVQPVARLSSCGTVCTSTPRATIDSATLRPVPHASMPLAYRSRRQTHRHAFQQRALEEWVRMCHAANVFERVEERTTVLDSPAGRRGARRRRR